MTRHLHSTDTLLSAGVQHMVAEVFAEKLIADEIVWNPETDEMVDRELSQADPAWFAEAEAAVRRLLAKVMLERAETEVAESLG